MGPRSNGGWLWDDDVLVLDNYHLRTLDGLAQTWLQPGSEKEYYPLEQTALWVMWHLWGDGRPAITSPRFSCTSRARCWSGDCFASSGSGWRGGGGLLFVLHPVQVESVAWIAELKNTLSLPLFVLAMCAWIDFDRSGKRADYLCALALFLVAILCKITVVMFPVVILLYAWWRRDRIAPADLRASAPFFAVSLAVGLITVATVGARQFHHLRMDAAAIGGPVGRVLLAGQEIAFYFSKSLVPVDLLPVYPKWAVDSGSPVSYLPWILLALVLAYLWAKRRTWGRAALLGLGFFLINLAPCPGFLPRPNMGYAWTMDHFLYLPIIGVIGLLIAGLDVMAKQMTPPLRTAGAILGVAVLALLAWQSHGYAGLYVNQKTLWTYTLQHNPAAWPAYNNLGNVWLAEGQLDQARPMFEQALALRPDDPEAHNNLGIVLKRTGHLHEAMNQYQLALASDPDYAEAHNNLGNVLLVTGHVEEARDHYERALKINPDFPNAHHNLGKALEKLGQMPAAMAEYEEALKLDPTLADAHYDLGLALLQAGQGPEAIAQLSEAVKLKPTVADMHNNFGVALFQAGRVNEAIDEFQHAIQLAPNMADAHANLGTALSAANRLPEALEEYRTALKIRPDYAAARDGFNQTEAQLKAEPKAP